MLIKVQRVIIQTHLPFYRVKFNQTPPKNYNIFNVNTVGHSRTTDGTTDNAPPAVLWQNPLHADTKQRLSAE